MNEETRKGIIEAILDGLKCTSFKEYGDAENVVRSVSPMVRGLLKSDEYALVDVTIDLPDFPHVARDGSSIYITRDQIYVRGQHPRYFPSEVQGKRLAASGEMRRMID